MDGQLVHDLRRRAPGRGAWVMVKKECLQKAHAGGFARSFKARVQAPPLQAFIESMREGILLRLKETVQTGLRARQLAVGQVAVTEAFKEDTVQLLFTGKGASTGTQTRFARNATRKGVSVSESLSAEMLGAWLGREFVSVLGVLNKERAARLLQDLERLSTLEAFEG